MNKKYNSSVFRGLATALFITLLITFQTIPAYASTSDDLRSYLGYTTEKHEPTKTNPYKDNEKEANNSGNNFNEHEYEGHISKLEEKLISLESQLNLAFEKNSSTKAIVNYIKSIDELKLEITKANEEKTLAKRMFSSDTIVDDYSGYSNRMYDPEKTVDEQFGGFLYDIGAIGELTITPVKGYFKIIESYGYKIDTEENILGENDHIKLGANTGESIVSIWNGVISSVDSNPYIGYDVTINHGNNLYTVYKHINPGSYYAGQKVSSGEVIGESLDTSSYYPNTDNFIEFQIVLDDTIINPILIFGENGEKAYKDWLSRSTEDFRVKDGESYYYTPEMSIVNPNNGDYSSYNTVEGAANLPEDYSKPNPGVVS